MLPPMSVTFTARAISTSPSKSPSTSPTGRSAGSASERRATCGAAPIAAMSLTFTASALKPMSVGVEKRRSKWTLSTNASVVSTCSRFLPPRTTAASSPMPRMMSGGGGGSRCRMRSITPRSPMLETGVVADLPGVFNGPGLSDDGDFDLARILQLVLDAAGDVFRQPDRLLVRDPFTLHHDADFAPRLQGKGLGHALEG